MAVTATAASSAARSPCSWAPGLTFSLNEAARPGASGASNAWLYGSLLAGGRALYPWPAAVLLLAGTLDAVRRGGSVRALVLFT